MGREQEKTELGVERVLLEETETPSLCVLLAAVQKARQCQATRILI